MAAVALAALLGAALFASQVDSPTVLEACTPCTSGPDCSAGCRTGAAFELRSRARMQQLATAQAAGSPPQPATGAGAGAVHASLHDQQAAIERRNKALLQLNAHTEGLSSVLDAAVKQVLRAEAAEVKLRRQAELSKGASVESVYKSLRYASWRARVGAGCASRRPSFSSEPEEPAGAGRRGVVKCLAAPVAQGAGMPRCRLLVRGR